MGERSPERWEVGKKMKKVAMGLCWDNLAYLMGGNLGCDFFVFSALGSDGWTIVGWIVGVVWVNVGKN